MHVNEIQSFRYRDIQHRGLMLNFACARSRCVMGPRIFTSNHASNRFLLCRGLIRNLTDETMDETEIQWIIRINFLLRLSSLLTTSSRWRPSSLRRTLCEMLLLSTHGVREMLLLILSVLRASTRERCNIRGKGDGAVPCELGECDLDLFEPSYKLRRRTTHLACSR